MKHIRLFMALLLLLISLSNVAQRRIPNISVAIGHRSQDSLAVRNVNVGIMGRADTLSGFQLQLLMASTKNDAHGVQIGGLFNAVGGRISGLQLSGVSNIAASVRGIQLSGFSNILLTPLRGMQISALTNISMGVGRGIQFAGIANISSGNVHGVQAGTYNYTDTLHGLQLGFINVAQTHPRGMQVGIINFTRDTQARKLGLVNINPQTDIDFLAFAGNTSKLNGALRFRNRSTYSIIGVGTHYMGLDSKFSGTLFYRLGQYFRLSPKWTVSGDIGYYHIETFERNSTDKPERLYSLQAHVNIDYQINRRLGAFASVGYGDTRYYYHNEHYRQRLIAQVGLSFRYQRNKVDRSLNGDPLTADTLQPGTDERMALPLKKRYWIAAAEATGINALVFGFDRFIMNEDFAQVNIHTIRNNFKTGFVWDNDPFATNLFAHPYHGNLYFNSARSNGLSFWESMPYAIGGSLMWEMLAECEPPAINDWMATSLGGTCLGEITNRISRMILNDRTQGLGRFLREAAAFIVNPMQGFNRLVRGEAYRVRNKNYLYHDFGQIPVELSLSFGNRYLADDGGLFRGEHNPYVNVYLEYGDIFSEETNKPYDYFSANLTLGLSGNQPLLNSAHLIGRLWSAPVVTGKRIKTEFGIFQHFNFYNSMPVKDGTSLTPYRISEAVAFGPGLVFRFPAVANLSRLEQRIFFDGIMLGGSKSDYYNVIDRDYNMGSGFSFKTNTVMEFPRLLRMVLNIDYYRIFTWKGYETKDLSSTDPLYYNVQGDRSIASLMVLNPMFVFRLKDRFSAEMSGSYFVRTTYYKYHENVRANTFEIKVGLVYRF